jgi:hypothetical protein
MPSLQIRRENPIDYLLKKKRLDTSSERSRGLSLSTAASQDKDALDIYLVELEGMNPEALDALYNAEKEKDRLAKLAELEYQDSRRFFHQPHAAADVAHWSKAAYWTLDEAVALAFGKEPSVVNASSLASYCEESLFAQRYAKALELAQRAADSQQLEKEPSPGVFLEWARRNDLPVPKALLHLVQAHGGSIIDWEERYGQLRQDHDDLLEELRRIEGNNGEPRASLAELSPFWSNLEQKVRRAIAEYPPWRASVRHVQKTKNLQEWLTDIIGADNREAEIIKKVLSDCFSELL